MVWISIAETFNRAHDLAGCEGLTQGGFAGRLPLLSAHSLTSELGLRARALGARAGQVRLFLRRPLIHTGLQTHLFLKSCPNRAQGDIGPSVGYQGDAKGNAVLSDAGRNR